MNNNKLFNQMMAEFVEYKKKVKTAKNDNDFYFFEGVCAGIAEVLIAMGYSQKDINKAYLDGAYQTKNTGTYEADAYQNHSGQDYWNGR